MDNLCVLTSPQLDSARKLIKIAKKGKGQMLKVEVVNLKRQNKLLLQKEFGIMANSRDVK